MTTDTAKTTDTRVERAARLRWVPIAKTRICPVAQRELNPARVDHLAADLDLEQIGTPTVNERDGHFYILDGQHRLEALKAIGFGDLDIQCWTYVDLTDEEMADRFDRLNDILAVSVLDRYRARRTAGREVECDIDRIVRANGYAITKAKTPGGIGAVGTVRRVYLRAGGNTLARVIRIAGTTWGDAGMTAPVIDGLGHLCQRYNGQIDDALLIQRLGAMRGGVGGLMGKADILKRQTGQPRGMCVAAALVDTYNAPKGGRKIPSWWKA